ncbi:MAG: hypothetical protein KJ559_01315 [Nanoarchaeota archaeon]|nr:hypothetical protein [Nanoarchaeota archaeon]
MNTNYNNIICPANEVIYGRKTGRCLDSGLLCDYSNNGEHEKCKRRKSLMRKLEHIAQSLKA